MSKENPYGDDAGTRIGRPSSPDRANENETDAGNEAARGIHGKKGGKSNEKGARPGSEPLDDREKQHESGYGGRGGDPKKSSDQR